MSIKQSPLKKDKQPAVNCPLSTFHCPLSPQFTITNSIANALTKIERARGFLDAATLSEEWIARMSRQALLREAHYTTHIEGTQLTLEQARMLWEGSIVDGARPDDITELLNYRDAFELVSEYLNKGWPISEALIREIHQRLVKGVRGGYATPGQYRLVQNYVANGRTGEVIYKPPAPEQVPDLMRDLVEWLQMDTDIHSVLVAGIAQFQLVHIHPFIDGNGRTSRLLSTLCLYQKGYDFKRLFTISEYYDRDRLAFYKAIQSVRENKMDLTCWLEYFTTGLATQLEEVKESGTRAIKLDILAREHGLNERQQSVFLCCAEKEGVSISDLTNQLSQIPRRTIQRDLKQLVDGKILIVAGYTNNKRYSLKEGIL